MPVTTTSEEWNALADRAEAATGPDRELDALIWLFTELEAKYCPQVQS